MTAKKQRESNIELFRIILMLLIVAHHYVVNSGLMTVAGEQAWSLRSLFYYLFGAWGKVGINCFVLITGYYMCRSKISLRKLLKLVLEVIFYSVTIYLLFAAVGYCPFSKKQLLLSFLPIRSLTDDFPSCYIAFFLLIPFLNRFLKAIDRKTHYYLILLLTSIFTLLPTFLFLEVRLNYVTWFVVIYLIGAYIRIYEPGRLMKNVGTKLSLLVMLSIGSIVVLAFLHDNTPFGIPIYHCMNDANKLFALLTAVYGFLFFKNLKIVYHRWINTTASAVFGVLLIHANSDTMRTWLWSDLLHNKAMYARPWGIAIAHAVLSVAVVFIVCVGIDLIRQRFPERVFFKWYDRNESRIHKKLRSTASRIISVSGQGDKELSDATFENETEINT